MIDKLIFGFVNLSLIKVNLFEIELSGIVNGEQRDINESFEIIVSLIIFFC